MIAVILVDLENIWRGLIRDQAETKKNPVGISAVFYGIRNITTTIKNQGKKVFVFVFVPPHYCNVFEIARDTDGLLWSFCPTFGVGRTRYNSADQIIIRLANLIAMTGNRHFCIHDFFGMGALSHIQVSAEQIFQSRKVPIFWPDGGSVNERRDSEKRTRAVLRSFLEGKELVTDVCLLSGDGDFQQAVERLQRRGIHVIVSTMSNDSLSPDLLAKADEFWDFPREPAPH